MSDFSRIVRYKLKLTDSFVDSQLLAWVDKSCSYFFTVSLAEHKDADAVTLLSPKGVHE